MVMKERTGLLSGFTQPIKTVAQRFAYVLLVITAFSIMLFGKIDPVFVERISFAVIDVVTPVLNVTSKITNMVASAVEETVKLYDTSKENDKLILENRRLQKWERSAIKLEAENKVLRNLLNFVPDKKASFITARVIADTSGVFANSIILNAGSVNNIKKGQAAINSEGLVGRVAGVGEHSSRVLLITDLNSRIPVFVQPGNIRAILAGDNSSYPRLIHLTPGMSIDQGKKVVTSGHGGVFPPGLPVGQVKSVDESGIRVRLFTGQSRLLYIRIFDYGIRGIVQEPEIESKNLKRGHYLLEQKEAE